MKNYYKYLKYKNKYLKLKQSGGKKTICNILRNPNINLNTKSDLYKTIEYWKSKNIINLNDILNIYKIDQFDPTPMFNESMNNFLQDISNNTDTRKEIDDSMRLFIYNYPNDIDISNDILKSLIYRCPCYKIEDTEILYYQNNVKEILGYDVDNFNDVNINIRYGILGLTYKNTKYIECIEENDTYRVLDNKLKETHGIENFYNIFKDSLKRHCKFWTYHIWGINLEKIYTKDSRYFLNLENIESAKIKKYKIIKSKEKDFLDIYTKLYSSIFNAAKYIMNTTKKNVGIKMPLIGLDNFLDTLSCEYKYNIQCKVLDIIYEIFKDENTHKEYIITLYLSIDKKKLKKYIRKKEKSDFIKFENIFFDISIPYSDELLLINIWNPHSYIGNGLCFNHTIEEILVTGKFEGITLQNSSYFHNPFLSQSILEKDKDKWIFL